jgi:hypothetical protein
MADTATRNRVAAQIALSEARLPKVERLLRNDLRLLQVEYQRTLVDDRKDPAVPRLAEAACSDAARGKDLSPHLNRVTKWPRSAERDSLWSLLASWEIMVRFDRVNRELVSDLIAPLQHQTMAAEKQNGHLVKRPF